MDINWKLDPDYDHDTVWDLFVEGEKYSKGWIILGVHDRKVHYAKFTTGDYIEHLMGSTLEEAKAWMTATYAMGITQ